MLNIITGKTGSGKSKMCLEAFSEHIMNFTSFFNDRTDAYYFVPEQFAVTEEKRLLNMTDKPLAGYEITNFKRFAYRLISEYGGVDTKKQLTPAGSVMLLTKVINDNSHNLQYFTELLESPRQLALVMSLIDEFNKYDVSPEDLLNPEVRNALLSSSASKFDDLALILESYRNNILNSYSDDRTIYKTALEIIEKNNIFDDCNIWIDNFTGFTNIEYKFITLMIKNAHSVNITLSTSLDNDMIYDPIDNTYRALVNICKKTNTPYKNINLPEPRHDDKNISLVTHSDMFAEVRSCAERIVELNKNGTDYNDFVICCREISDYDTLIMSVFNKYGIPVHIDSKKTIDSNPLIKAIMSIVNIILNNWRPDDVLSLLKTGMFNVNPDKLENNILRFGLKGKKSWEECEDRECLYLFNKIIPFETSLKEAKDIHTVICVLCDFMQKNRFDKIIKEKADEFLRLNMLDYANEYYRTWNIVIEIFNQIDAFLGDIKVSGVHNALNTLKRFLDSGFSGSKIGFIPQMNSCVNVINIERLRTQNKKYLFFLGANEEFLPKKFDDGGLLKDKERDALSAVGVALADDTQQRSCKEYFFIDNLVKNKVDNLIVSYSLSTLTGDEMHPSAALISKINEYPHEKINFSSDLKYHTTETVLQPVILNDELVNTLFHPDKKKYSVSTIEKYIQCPYKFFIESGMYIDERECAELLNSDIGNVMHDAVSASCDKLSTYKIVDITKELCVETADSVFESIISSQKYKYILKNNRNLRLIERLRDFSGSILWYVFEKARSNHFVPFMYEYAYDPVSISIDYKNCKDISLIGRIDRCDVLENESGRYIRVIDYKSSDHAISAGEIYRGIKLQLISYLYAFLKNFPEYKPAAINYFVFDSDIVSGKAEDFANKNDVKYKYSMKGFTLDDEDIMTASGKKRRDNNTISEEEFNNLFDSFEKHVKTMITNVLDGKFSPYPNATEDVDPCKFCNAKSICGIKKSACNGK